MPNASSYLPAGFSILSIHLTVDGAAKYIEFLKQAFDADVFKMQRCASDTSTVRRQQTPVALETLQIVSSSYPGRFEFTFLGPQAGIIANRPNPVHDLAGRVKADNFVVWLADVFDRTDFLMADSSHAVV